MNQYLGVVDTGRTTPPRAIDWPATRAALGHRRLWLWLLVLVSFACGPLSVVLIDKFDQPGIHGAGKAGRFLILPAVLIFVFGLMFGITYLWMGRRRHKALKRNPWIRWPVNYITTGRYEWVELLDGNRQPVSTLILSTWAQDIGKLVNHRTSEIWFAGDPQKYGVVSMHDGGGPLRYAYHSGARQPPKPAFLEPTSEDSDLSEAPTVRATTYELEREGGQVRMRSSGGHAEEPKPKRHGALDDPDYPSPRKLRRGSSFALDWVIHVGAGVAVGLAAAPEPARTALLHRDWHSLGPIPVLAVACFLAASFVDRVIVQAFVHTTIGKAVFGLVALRPDTGHYPSFWRLVGIWLMDVYLIIIIPLELLGPGGSLGPDRPEDYFLTAIRWRDRRFRRTERPTR